MYILFILNKTNKLCSFSQWNITEQICYDISPNIQMHIQRIGRRHGTILKLQRKSSLTQPLLDYILPNNIASTNSKSTLIQQYFEKICHWPRFQFKRIILEDSYPHICSLIEQRNPILDDLMDILASYLHNNMALITVSTAL